MSRRAIVFHSLAQADAALSAAAGLGVPVTLRTAPGAAAYAGSAYLKAIVDRAAEAHPDVALTAVIDCGEDAGHALGALRIGWRRVVFAGRDDVFAKLADIARQRDGAVERHRPGTAILDLDDAADPAAACRDFLASHGA